jgi:hypothetical protein
MARNINVLVTLVLLLSNFLHGSLAINFWIGSSHLGRGIPYKSSSHSHINWGTEKTLTVGDGLGK